MTGFNSDNSMQNLNMGLYMAQMGGLNKLQMPLASSLDYNLFSAYPMGMNLGGQIDMSNATIFNNPCLHLTFHLWHFKGLIRLDKAFQCLLVSQGIIFQTLILV